MHYAPCVWRTYKVNYSEHFEACETTSDVEAVYTQLRREIQRQMQAAYQRQFKEYSRLANAKKEAMRRTQEAGNDED